MSKSFRTDHLDQGLLLPPSLHDWLPEKHLARFIADMVEELDLSAVYLSYESDGRGLAAYQPAMMVRLLLYGYCVGVVSSRKMERATHEDVAFRYLSADTHPDRDTISAFRKRHLEALGGLFVQALRLCQKAIPDWLLWRIPDRGVPVLAVSDASARMKQIRSFMPA